MRKTMKILHTISACGLIGGLACYMILLAVAPQDTAAAYADLRRSIQTISDWVLVPSLAIALVSGLLSMVVHKPFMDKGWALLKAAMGILMFKGVLTVIAAEAKHAATLAGRIAEGEAADDLLQQAIASEWVALWTVMALSVANVVLGVWRPRLSRKPAVKGHRARPRPSEAPHEMPAAAASEERPARAA